MQIIQEEQQLKTKALRMENNKRCFLYLSKSWKFLLLKSPSKG